MITQWEKFSIKPCISYEDLVELRQVYISYAVSYLILICTFFSFFLLLSPVSVHITGTRREFFAGLDFEKDQQIVYVKGQFSDRFLGFSRRRTQLFVLNGQSPSYWKFISLLCVIGVVSPVGGRLCWL